MSDRLSGICSPPGSMQRNALPLCVHLQCVHFTLCKPLAALAVRLQLLQCASGSHVYSRRVHASPRLRYGEHFEKRVYRFWLPSVRFTFHWTSLCMSLNRNPSFSPKFTRSDSLRFFAFRPNLNLLSSFSRFQANSRPPTTNYRCDRIP